MKHFIYATLLIIFPHYHFINIIPNPLNIIQPLYFISTVQNSNNELREYGEMRPSKTHNINKEVKVLALTESSKRLPNVEMIKVTFSCKLLAQCYVCRRELSTTRKVTEKTTYSLTK